MSLFRLSEEMIAMQEEDAILFARDKCGCYMNNASCGGSADFGTATSGGVAQACAQSYLSTGQSAHSSNCP